MFYEVKGDLLFPVENRRWAALKSTAEHVVNHHFNQKTQQRSLRNTYSLDTLPCACVHRVLLRLAALPHFFVP
jgi:hypothetical protein